MQPTFMNSKKQNQNSHSSALPMRPMRQTRSPLFRAIVFTLVAVMTWTSVGSIARASDDGGRLAERNMSRSDVPLGDASDAFDKLLRKRWDLAHLQAQLDSAKAAKTTWVCFFVLSSAVSLVVGAMGVKILYKKGQNYFLGKETDPELTQQSLATGALLTTLSVANGNAAHESYIRVTMKANLIDELQRAIQKKQVEVDHAVAMFEAAQGH